MTYSHFNKKLYEKRHYYQCLFSSFKLWAGYSSETFMMGSNVFFYHYRLFTWENAWYWIAKVFLFLGFRLLPRPVHLVDHKSRCYSGAVHYPSQFGIIQYIHQIQIFGFRTVVPLYILFTSSLLRIQNPWHIMVVYAIIQVYGTCRYIPKQLKHGYIRIYSVTPSPPPCTPTLATSAIWIKTWYDAYCMG